MGAKDVLRKMKLYLESSSGKDVDEFRDGYLLGGRYKSDVDKMRFELGAGYEYGNRPMLQIVSGDDGVKLERVSEGRSYMDTEDFSGSSMGITAEERVDILKAL